MLPGSLPEQCSAITGIIEQDHTAGPFDDASRGRHEASGDALRSQLACRGQGNGCLSRVALRRYILIPVRGLGLFQGNLHLTPSIDQACIDPFVLAIDGLVARRDLDLLADGRDRGTLDQDRHVRQRLAGLDHDVGVDQRMITGSIVAQSDRWSGRDFGLRKNKIWQREENQCRQVRNAHGNPLVGNLTDG